MNDGALQQIDRLTSRAIDRGTREFGDRVQAIYAAHSARGVLQSGATIKAAIREMEACAREAMTGLLQDVRSVSQTPEAFSRIDEAVQALLAALATILPDIIGKTGNKPGSSASSAALGLYHTMKSDVTADLLIARHSFLSDNAQGTDTPQQPARNKGGKPLAAHWDDMWAAIAVQLWNGDLKPTKQGDIKQAMLDWFVANEIEIGDTAVTDRARQLWLKIEAER